MIFSLYIPIPIGSYIPIYIYIHYIPIGFPNRHWVGWLVQTHRRFLCDESLEHTRHVDINDPGVKSLRTVNPWKLTGNKGSWIFSAATTLISICIYICVYVYVYVYLYFHTCIYVCIICDTFIVISEFRSITWKIRQRRMWSFDGFAMECFFSFQTW